MDFFDSNIQELDKKNVHFLNLENQFGEQLAFAGTDKEGVKWFWDSSHNPVAVSSKIDDVNLPDSNIRQVIFFFGLASVDEILQVAERAHPESFFLIIEPNLSLLRHALAEEDFRRLANLNYMVAAVEPQQISEIINPLIYTKIFLLCKNAIFYLNSYYRQKDMNLVKEFIKEIGTCIKHKYFVIGNSIYDSLIGLIANMQNLKTISVGPDVAALKEKFKGVPVFIVSAGPSLDKNIECLKQIGNKGIIIAVDAIAEKLIKNGIKPHFISSVERINVWEHFYENKPKYYNDAYLVAPPLVQPEVIQAYEGRVILPMRECVCEYAWLRDILELSEDYNVWMGLSCAHIAFGFALHIGASPIVFVGQDLAYGGDITQTHASGTIHEVKPMAQPEEVLTVEGYYGGEVKTHPIWFEFKLMFENKIGTVATPIFNATEGGARIKGAVEKPLREIISEFCNREIDTLGEVKNIHQTQINWDNVESKLSDYVQHLEQLSKKSMRQLKKLEDIRDKWDYYIKDKGVNYIFRILKKTEKFFQYVPQDKLLYHNLQGPLVIVIQKFHLIAEDGSMDSLKQNILVQIEFCELFTNTTWLIAQVIQENFQWTNGKNGVENADV